MPSARTSEEVDTKKFRELDSSIGALSNYLKITSWSEVVVAVVLSRCVIHQVERRRMVDNPNDYTMCSGVVIQFHGQHSISY